MCRQRRSESGRDSSGKRFCEKRERRAQNFSAVHVDGVNTEQQGGQCSLGRGEAARVVGEEVREEMGGLHHARIFRDFKDLGFYSM